jgi:hypothetical protein
MDSANTTEWRLLLRLVLAKRLEINAIESALKRANALTDAEIKAIRKQASETAEAWSAGDHDDILTLIRVHASPHATMLVPPAEES